MEDIEKEIREKPHEFWPTGDAAEAGAITEIMGEDPVMLCKFRTVTMFYRKTDALRRALQMYKDNVPLPCRSLLENVKRIRSNLMILKTLSEKRPR